MNIIVLLLNLKFSLKYQSRNIMDCCCMRFVLFEDLRNVNSGMNLYVCMWNTIACDFDDNIDMR